MKKHKIIYLIFIISVLFLLLVNIINNPSQPNTHVDTYNDKKTNISISGNNNVIKEDSDTEINKFEIAISDMNEKISDIEAINDKKEWFILYKNIINEYSDIIDPPETIYDYYSDEELNLLFRVVEAEATAGGFYEKANVASVIFNRINHESFGNTLSDILVKKQFSCISDGRYLKVNISEDTILACEYVFMIEDTTNGSIFFEAGGNAHSAYADYVFTDAIGHNFYVERKQ